MDSTIVGGTAITFSVIPCMHAFSLVLICLLYLSFLIS